MPDAKVGASAAEIRAQIEAGTPPKTEVGETKDTPSAPSEVELTEGTVETETLKPESKLYAGKYESPEELEKAYLESQKKMHEKTQEASSTKKLVQELYGEKEESTVEKIPDTDNLTEEEAEAYLAKVVDTRIESKLKTVVEPYIADLEVERVKAKNPDLPQLIPTLKKVYEEFPMLKRPGNLERAIKIARADYLPEVVDQARKEGEQQATAKMEEEKAAQTESAKSTSREDKLSLSPEAIKKMSAAELRELLP